MVRTYALTGTPGTGKTSVAQLLARGGGPRKPRVLEVPELLPRSRLSARGSAPVVVDLAAAGRALRRIARQKGPPCIVVGHLSHLLPVDGVLLLRCRPDELARRLQRRGGPMEDLRANVEAEAVDTVLLEALELGRPIWELDTTRCAPRSVASWVCRVLQGKVKPGVLGVDWLRQSRVIDTLERDVRVGRPWSRGRGGPTWERRARAAPPWLHSH